MTLNNVRPKAAAYYTSQYYGSQESLASTPGVPSRSAPTTTRRARRRGRRHGGSAAGRGARARGGPPGGGRVEGAHHPAYGDPPPPDRDAAGTRWDGVPDGRSGAHQHGRFGHLFDPALTA